MYLSKRSMVEMLLFGYGLLAMMWFHTLESEDTEKKECVVYHVNAPEHLRCRYE